MKFLQYYSGSSANLYTVEADNGKRLMIECGARFDQIQNALGYRLDNVAGCLLTHEHKDHSKSVLNVLKSGIEVYASPGTWRMLAVENQRRAIILGEREKWYTPVNGDFQFMPFQTHHDAEDPVGFVVQCDGEFLLFSTDTSHITQRFNVPFSIIAIECSFDRDILQKRVDENDIDENLAKRLLTSHMEKQTTIKYLAECCDLSKCREIHLLHLSRENIDAEATRKEIEERVFIKTITV
jgi:phosphoribosyl 1,2-cyclic phosphodiesterase